MTKSLYLFLCLPILIITSAPAYAVVIGGVDEVRPYIQQGKAGQYLPQYEERARKFEESGDLKKAAETYLNAQHLARAAGNYQKALILGTKAIDVAEAAGYYGFLTKALMQTGQTYFVLADYDRAIAHFERAVTLGKRIKNVFAEASGHEKLAKVYRKMDQPIKSLEYLKNAGSIYVTLIADISNPDVSPSKASKRAKRKFSNPAVVRTYVNILTSQGSTNLRLQAYEAALEDFNKALYYSSDKDQVMEVYNGIGDLHRRKGDLQKALEYHEKALKMAEELNIPWHMMVSLSKTAMDYHHQNNYKEAIERYARAIVFIEEQRSMLQNEEMRSLFFAQMTRTYDGMISALISAGQAEKAFDYSERGRSRAFIDVLGSKVNLSHGRASEMVSQEMELKRRIAAHELLYEESDSGEGREELTELKKDYNRFLERLRKEDLEHASLLSVEPLSLRDIQSRLAPNTALLEFHMLDDRVLLWTVRKEEMKVDVIPFGRRAITGRVKRLRESISNTLAEAPVIQAARDLYDVFLLRAGIRKGEHLVIVPHGILHYLPFHILRQPDNRYLLEDHTVSYLSSAGLMQFTSEKQKKMQGNMIAFGNPDLGNLIYNLRYAEREAREIGSLYPQSEIYLGKDASLQRVEKSLAGYGVIHFASHGEFSEDNPLESSIMLSGKNIESGRLKTEDIFALNIDASLVVLSACETAIGKVNTGDEIIGLTRAFIYAGTPSVITSLWRVNDKATYLLMSSFYRNLKTMGKAEALRSAQRSVMKDYQHPFYWGAFTLNGDPG
ncbi:MAG: CHAT domain-containing protein [Nitrospirota bacterium]|nr:CHAT domain-containing protein [Nitrospirota bacterium]